MPRDSQSTAETLHRITSDNGLTGYPAISRDGKLIAFASDRSTHDNLDIWVQQIGGGDPIRLTSDPADERDPSFSPDGTVIAFQSGKDGGGIYVMPSLGGTPVLLAARGHNPRFSPDGRWVAYSVGGTEVSSPGTTGVFIVSAGGGVPRAVHPEMATATSPVWSPSSDRLLVIGRKDPRAAARTEVDWWILPIDGGAPARSGVYARLRAQELLRPQFPQVYPAPLDWRDGDQILFSAYSGEAANLWEISLRDSARREPARRVTAGPGLHGPAHWSGDAKRLVFAAEDLSFDVWMQPVDAASGAARGDMRRLAGESAENLTPSISWDGKQIAYVSRRWDRWSVRMREAASGEERALLENSFRFSTARISGDGSRVVYSGANGDLLSVGSSGGIAQTLCEHCGTLMGVSNEAEELLFEPAEDEDLMMYDTRRKAMVKLALRPAPETILSGSRFSRDSKWVAFHAVKNANNTAQIWIVPRTETTPVPQSEWIAITDGSQMERDPAWSADGRVLYFISERDGFRCVWARRMNPDSKQPLGEAFPVRHFHSERLSLRHVGSRGYITGLSAGEGSLIFSIGDLRANIWIEERTNAERTK